MDYTKNLFKLDDYTSIAGVTLNGESKLSYINERVSSIGVDQCLTIM